MHLTRRLCTIAGAAALTLSSVAWGQARDTGEILRELESLEAPKYDASKREDREYVTRFYQDRQAYMDQRASLAKELFEADPAHPDVPKLMAERWSTLSQKRDYDQVLAETEPLAAGESPLALDAAFTHAQAYGMKHNWDLAACGGVIDAAIARAPQDERGARLLYSAAQSAGDTGAQLTLYRRLLKDYPDSRTSRYAPGKIQQLEGVGKPFELAFQNAVDGQTIDLASHKGTIFVIDFWATWCGPCIAEMPHMKELYAQYRGKGVEFVGVSLDQPEDQGGLEKLLAYVKDNEIGWPQYYQGAGWESEFSTSWGINAIPCLFVVDHEGNLFSTSARGKLEEFLPMLIDRRDPGN